MQNKETNKRIDQEWQITFKRVQDTRQILERDSTHFTLIAFNYPSATVVTQVFSTIVQHLSLL